MITNPQMSEHVDVEQGVDFAGSSFEQWLAGHNACVVDQHRDVTNLAAHLVCQGVDSLAVCDVTSVNRHDFI